MLQLVFHSFAISASLAIGQFSSTRYSVPVFDASSSRIVPVEFVSRGSLFSNSYVASGVGGFDSIRIVSVRKPERQSEEDIRAYVKERLGLIGDDVEVGVELLVRSDEAIADWLGRLDQMDLNDLDRARLATAADKLRLEQLKMEFALANQMRKRSSKWHSEYLGETELVQKKALRDFRRNLNDMTGVGHE